MKHPHAELMLEYAQDAMETDKPWERWEFRSVIGDKWRGVNNYPAWLASYEYRRKPKPYEPTLLDQAIELEIESLRLRINYFIDSPTTVQSYRVVLDQVKQGRSPAMINHLKTQGKL